MPDTSQTRVFIVDDSAVCRLGLRRMLEQDRRIGIIGEADNGKTALERIARARPDVVLMDVVMPQLDGLEVTRRLMSTSPVPIVIVSDLATARSTLNFDALQAGALEVLAKPGRRELEDTARCAALCRRIRLLSQVPVVTRRGRNDHSGERAAGGAAPDARRDFQLLCIGASTGGPAALSNLLATLGGQQTSRGLPWPILLVQHIVPDFVEGMAAWLARCSALTVDVVRDATVPQPGTVYVAAGGMHLRYRHGRLVLSGEPRDTAHRPSIDELFTSVAESEAGAGALALLLTGMGRDGAQGLLRIKEAGGWTLAQDQETSVVWGMPGEAVRLGAAREVLPIRGIAERVLALSRRQRRKEES